MVKAQEQTTVDRMADARLTTPVGKTIQRAYLVLEDTIPKLAEKDQRILTSALGALRKVMKVKLTKKSTTVGAKDEPGSDKLKEAYLTMIQAQKYAPKNKKMANLCKTILDPLTRLAQAKCTIGKDEAPKKWKSTILGCAMYVQELLADIENGPLFVAKKEKSSIQHSSKMVTVLVNKLNS